MFMFCLVVWSVVIFADYPRYADATPAVWVIENRESLQITPLGGTKGDEHDGLVEAGPKAIIDEGDGSDALVVISESPASIEEKIRKAWAGTGQEDVAVAVAKAESRLIHNNIGDLAIVYWEDGKQYGMSVGVFQIRILPGRPDIGTLLNVDENIRFARDLWERSGWQPWSVYKSGSYLNYL